MNLIPDPVYYEYKVIEWHSTGNPNDATIFINTLGYDGWEYVEGMFGGSMGPRDILFRRRLKTVLVPPP